MKHIAAIFGVKEGSIAKNPKGRALNSARAFAMYASQEYGDMGLKEIAKAFGLGHTGSASFSINRGCTRTHSYFANFHKIFWQGRYTKEEHVYDDHPRDFVSDYAGTNTVEDLAETFAVFVFNQKKQSANTVAERKINFFHRYQELAAMRANIRAALKPFVHKRLRGL